MSARPPCKSCGLVNEVSAATCVACFSTLPKLEGDASASQEFLDAQQYAISSILRYEKIFGKHFISTGGVTTTEELVAKLDLQPGDRVLDVGCGIGGSAFYMAHNFQAEVLGIDLSTNMLSIAQKNLPSEKANFVVPGAVRFEVADALKIELEPASFDVIYSRDTILHIFEKSRLFERFLTWLKPGGKLLITDYACGPPPHSEEFQAYVAQRGYHLTTVEEYGQLIHGAGFRRVNAENRTEQFVAILTSELEKFTSEESKADFEEEFSADDFSHIVDGWSIKQQRCRNGDQAWGAYFAVKPESEEAEDFVESYF